MHFALSSRSRARGFTLIEMMTAIVVLAVILAIAVPNLAGFVRTSRVRGAQSELISSLMLARSEAAKRGVTVSVGASAPVAGSEFSAGWTVWIDANADGAVNSGETVIRQYPDISSAVVIRSRVGATSTSSVSFASTGFLTPASTVSFSVCGKNDTTNGYDVELQPVGLADLNDHAQCPPP